MNNMAPADKERKRGFPTLTSQKLLLRKPQIIIFYYRVIGLRIFPPKTPKETIKSIIFNF